MFFSPGRKSHFSSQKDRNAGHDSPVTPLSENRPRDSQVNQIPNRPSTGTPAPWTSRVTSEARYAGDRERAMINDAARQSNLNEESDGLLGRLFHEFLVSGRVDDSLEKLRTSGAFQKDDETNDFIRVSKSIVDTLAKHWTTMRGAEIAAMAAVSAQLVDKQQKHHKYLQFLALSKCHEELFSTHRHSLHTIMEHGEKLAAIIQLRELQSTLSQNRSSRTGVPSIGSPDEMAGSLWDLIQLVGEKARKNTVLLMDRDNAEVFYSKVSDLEEIFYCLSFQIQHLIGEERPILIQTSRVCELSNACTILIRSAMQYRNDYSPWYPTPEGLMPWYCQPVVRNGLWCVASFMLQLLKTLANGKEKLALYSHLEQLTDVLLESYSGANTAKLERQEEHKILLDEYWERRDELLGSLYQHIKDFLDEKHQHPTEGMEESKEEDLRKYSSSLLSIARRHEGYQTLWDICCDLNDSALLRSLMHESVGPKRGFSYFVFMKMYENRQFAKLLRLGEEFQEELAIFLRQHNDLLWLHELFVNHFSSASETLHALSLSQKDVAPVTEDGTDLDHVRWGPSLADRKRLLNLSKIAALAGRDDDSVMRTRRIDADLKILKLQEEIVALLTDNKEEQHIGQELLPPGQLIELCLSGNTEELTLRAFEVFAWTSSSFRLSNRRLLEECWKSAAEQDDWESLHQAFKKEGWSDQQTLENLSQTVLFKASERCYGPLAETYEGGFEEVLPLSQSDVDQPILQDSTSSVEVILRQHKSFPYVGELMLTAITLGKEGMESIAEEQTFVTPME